MTVQAVAVQAAPVVAEVVVATPLPDARLAPSARTSNPLSIGSARIAPGTTASPVAASAMVASESAEVGIAATFEVEDDFDEPNAESFSTSTLAAPAVASPYRAPESKLSEFLVANELGQFEEQLRVLGAVDVPDLRELEEVRAATTASPVCGIQPGGGLSLRPGVVVAQEDMVRVGMKPLEIKRLRRGLAAKDQNDV